MAPHDLGNTKTTILGATPGAIPGIDGNPHEIFSFAPPFSEPFFENWGGPRAQEIWIRDKSAKKYVLFGKLSGKKKAHKLLTHKLFGAGVSPGKPEEHAYFAGFGGEHMNFLPG